jgi:hypothetical protein
MWKEEFKVLLFADDMVLELRDPKNSTKKLLEVIITFGKVAGYRNQYIEINVLCI